MIDISFLKQKVEKPDIRFKTMRSMQKKLEMHVTGKGLSSYMEKIEGFENDDQLDLRDKYTKSNKDVFKSLLSPLEKIFSAKGGTKVYHFSSKVAEKKFNEAIQDIRDGLSLSKWVENYWKQKAAIDPNGIVLIEHKEGKAYPVFYSIQNIIEYKRNGQYINWVIFQPVKKDNIDHYRVYDETGDYTYKKTSDGFSKVDEYKNPWGYVPGIVVSDILDTENHFSKSIIDEQVEIADHLLLEGSIKSVYTFKFGFPLTWQYKTPCPSCKGTGEIDGKECSYCHGSRYDHKRDVSKVMLIDPPDIGAPTVTPDVSGFSSPDLGAMEQFNTEIDRFKNELWFSKWGTTLEHQKSETATGRFIDAQPVNDVLNFHADSIENFEKLLTDIIAEYYYKGIYIGCSINLGRRYLIETPDQLMNKYVEWKSKGLSEIQLTYLLLQYYQTEFSRDAYSYSKYKMILQIDPFPHSTINDVLQMNVPEDLKQKKLYIDQWSRLLTKDEFIGKTVDELNKMFNQYIKENANLQGNSSRYL